LVLPPLIEPEIGSALEAKLVNDVFGEKLPPIIISFFPFPFLPPNELERVRIPVVP
jgi:hypothetical protein